MKSYLHRVFSVTLSFLSMLWVVANPESILRVQVILFALLFLCLGCLQKKIFLLWIKVFIPCALLGTYFIYTAHPVRQGMFEYDRMAITNFVLSTLLAISIIIILIKLYTTREKKSM